MKLMILFLSFILNYNAQEPIELYRIPAESYTNFEIDHLGNLYVVINDQLNKFDTYGRKIASYTNKELGKINSIDVSNPLRILIFYNAPNKLIWLDNSLAPVGDVVSLNESGFGPIDLVCNTRARGFWCYTSNNFQLMLLDKNLNKINVTSNLDRISKTNLNPNAIIEANGKVYLNNPETGILVFEQYGGYLETIPIKNLFYFQIVNTGVQYLENGNLMEYNFAQKNSGKIYTPIKTVKKVLSKGKIIYEGVDNEIVISKLL